jgi:twitching motility protein PilT
VTDGLEVLDPYLTELWDRRGTDLLFTVGTPPVVRVDGNITPLERGPLRAEDIDAIVAKVLDEEQAADLARGREVDFSFSWREDARLRGHAFRQRGAAALALRLIPLAIPGFSALGLPPVASQLVRLPYGLVLVTGPTGSGKSTTLASMIDSINAERALHILTIEDPIEYLHGHRRSVVNQREIGADSESFAQALRSALREDPDVLLVGEMRDLDSISIALTIAETGHLVFASLHTNDTAQALDRIVDVFPSERQAQIRVQLAASLQAVIYQRLVPRVGGGRLAAFEVLLATPPVRNLVREGKTNQLRNVIVTSQHDGMQTLEMSLGGLVKAGAVTLADAEAVSLFPKDIARSAT